MENSTRLANYEKANAGRPLTGPQIRRLARHGAERGSEWAVREGRRQPIRQHFRPVIDNQHLPTGRVGMKRFGPALSRLQLDQLFSHALVPVRLRPRPDQAAAEESEVERVVTQSAPAKAIRRERGGKRGG